MSNGSMYVSMKRALPEPVKAPLRAFKSRAQHLLYWRFFRKGMTLDQLNRLFRRNRYAYLATYTDDQVITRHNADFGQQEHFLRAYQFARGLANEERPAWSAYLVQWAARQAARAEGDFVECGTARGFTAASLLSSVDLGALQKRLFLFDSWSGVSADTLTAHERRLYHGRLEAFNGSFSGYYDEVKAAFAPYPWVTLVKGYVPESLSQVEIPSVCFLHLDMNAVHPEVEALRYFWPRLSPGAWVVLDDYGQPGRGEQKRGMDQAARELGCEVFASPTGQGLIVK